MRRKEKEITSREVIDEILGRAVVCRLALNDEGSPHLIPVNFGYDRNVLYFHSAPAGRKIELISKEPRATFEVTDFHRIITGDLACGWTTEYRSVIGTGKIEIVTENDVKRQGLDIIMRQHGMEGPYSYSEGSLNRMVVLKLVIDSVTGKQSDEPGEDKTSVWGAGAELLEMAKQYKALAETGLKYQPVEYDQERYGQIREMAIKMMALLSGSDPVEIESFFTPVTDYPTPKVDVRGLVMDDHGRILMVRERVDGKWTLPGGWADIGLSPSEVAVKEVSEESGLKVEAERLLAVYDKRCHVHPPSPYYIYKLVFLCRATGGELKPGFDILDAAWIDPEALPELSADRILEEQIAALVKQAVSGSVETIFD
jgi:nitroimidazol reductase NimA-like FMN-containing flavoprotein (pyridoxamine 5'-phosphate oxidase superfamily)/ADP-ribose pyrophosphatase YjhB (NUDIX family)